MVMLFVRNFVFLARISEMAKKNNKKKGKKEVKETPKVEEEKTTIIGSFA